MTKEEFLKLIQTKKPSVYDLDMMSVGELIYHLIDVYDDLVYKVGMSEEMVRQTITEIANQLIETGRLNVGIDDTQALPGKTFSSQKIMELIDELKTNQSSVNPLSFGVILDGTDQTDSVKACHDYANLSGAKVIYPKGKLKVTNEIEVKTDVDLSQVELIVDADCIDKTLFKLIPDQEWEDVTAKCSSTDFTRGKTVLSALASKPNHVVHINSLTALCYRDGNLSVPYYKEEVNAHLRDGELIYKGLLCNYSEATGFSVKVRPFDKATIIRLGEINYQITTVNKTCVVLDIARDNVRVLDGQIKIYSRDNVQNTTWVGNLFSIHHCIEVEFNNLVAPNITGQITSGNSGYVMQPERMAGLHLNRLRLTSDTWGSIGCNNVKDIRVKDSHLNRMDCHILNGDISIENTRICGEQGVSVGIGTGKVLISNCRYDHPKCNAIVSHRNDYGGMYEGDIVIENTSFASSTEQTYTYVLNLGKINGNCLNVDYQGQMPSLYARNISLRTGKECIVYGIPVLDNGATAKLPQMVVADNIHQVAESSSVFVAVMDAKRAMSQIVASPFKTNIIIRNVNHIPETVISKDSVDDYDNYRHLFRLMITDATADNHLPQIKLTCENSCGGFRLRNHQSIVDISHCTLHNYSVDYGSGLSPAHVRVSNSTIIPPCYSNGTSQALSVNNTQMIGCLILNVTINGTSNTVTLEGVAQLLVGNAVKNPTNPTVANTLYQTINSEFAQV